MSLYYVYLDNQQTVPTMSPLINSQVGNSKILYNNDYAMLASKMACPLTLAPGNNMDMKLDSWSFLTGLSANNKPDTSKHFHIFVGDLCPNLQPYQLLESFASFGQISECKIIQDPQTLKYKGYGFVTFVKKDDAENAIKQMNGKVLGSRPIRTNWAVRKNTDKSEGNCNPSISFDEIFNQTHENNCTVYCGGVMTGLSEELMKSSFIEFGSIQEIRLFKEKGYAFIRFCSKEEATRAIIGRHLTEINGHIVKCSWGKKNDDITQACSSASPIPFASLSHMHSSTSPSVSALPTVAMLTQPYSSSYLNLQSYNSLDTKQLGYYIYPQNVYQKAPEEKILCQQTYNSIPLQIPSVRTIVQPQSNLGFHSPPTNNFMYSL